LAHLNLVKTLLFLQPAFISLIFGGFMVLDFTIEIQDYKGNAIQGDLADLIANLLLNKEFTGGGDIKKFVLAQKIYTDKTVEIDDADYNLIKDAINFKGRQDMIGAAIRAPLLLELERQEKIK
jgi:hypothetical protein